MLELDFEVDVPGVCKVALEIVWGGMIYIMPDAAKLGVSITREKGKELVNWVRRLNAPRWTRSPLVIRETHPSVVSAI